MIISFQINGTSGCEQVLLPTVLLHREDFFQTEVLKACFGQSSCSCSPPVSSRCVSTPHSMFSSFTPCSLQKPPWNQSPPPALPVLQQHGHGLSWSVGCGLATGVSFQQGEVPREMGRLCVPNTSWPFPLQSPWASRCSELLVPSFKGGFLSSASQGEEEGAELEGHGLVSLVVNAAISLGFNNKGYLCPPGKPPLCCSLYSAEVPEWGNPSPFPSDVIPERSGCWEIINCQTSCLCRLPPVAK